MEDPRLLSDHRLLATVQRVAEECRDIVPQAAAIADALRRDDVEDAVRLAREVTCDAPLWRTEESAFSLLVAVRRDPSCVDALEPVLNAIANDRTRDETLDCARRGDWDGVEHALRLTPGERLAVYCEYLAMGYVKSHHATR